MLCMDEISSSDFRRTYASLRKPTAVTVNGHVIGEWIPANSATYVMATRKNGEHEVFGLTPPGGASTRPPQDGDPLFSGGMPPGDRFNSQPFNGPIPKKGK